MAKPSATSSAPASLDLETLRLRFLRVLYFTAELQRVFRPPRPRAKSFSFLPDPLSLSSPGASLPRRPQLPRPRRPPHRRRSLLPHLRPIQNPQRRIHPARRLSILDQKIPHRRRCLPLHGLDPPQLRSLPRHAPRLPRSLRLTRHRPRSSPRRLRPPPQSPRPDLHAHSALLLRLPRLLRPPLAILRRKPKPLRLRPLLPHLPLRPLRLCLVPPIAPSKGLDTA